MHNLPPVAAEAGELESTRMAHALATDVPRSGVAGLRFSDVTPSPLARLIVDLDDAVADDLGRVEESVAAALRHHLKERDLLRGVPCSALSHRYARHLLHAGIGYSLLALVWRPGQMSSVHGHKTWCVLGVHCGSLTESVLELGRSGLHLVRAQQHFPGAVSYSGDGPGSAHRIANLGIETAVSIHIYGVPFDLIGDAVNRVWAE